MSGSVKCKPDLAFVPAGRMLLQGRGPVCCVGMLWVLEALDPSRLLPSVSLCSFQRVSSLQPRRSWCLGGRGSFSPSRSYVLAAWDIFLHPDFDSLGVFGSKRQLYLPSGLCFGCLGRISASRLCRLGRVWVKKATVRPLRVMFCLLLESAGSRRGEMLSWPGGTGAVTLVCDGL